MPLLHYRRNRLFIALDPPVHGAPMRSTVLNYTGNWFLGACAAVMSVAALFVASHSGHGVAYYGGLAMFLFCVLFVMNLIRTSTGNVEEHGGAGRASHR